MITRYKRAKILKTPNDRRNKIIYTGFSMNPTLKTSDILEILPYNGRKIKKGDVIVFLAPADTRKVVHRIISVNNEGIRTRGDNRGNTIDPWIIYPENILGRVVNSNRGNKRLRIYGGLIGRSLVRTIKVIQLMDLTISNFLSPVYYWLARIRIFKRLLPIKRVLRVMSFNRPTGTEYQLFIGPYLIGRLIPGSNRWHIKRPFRLFIDEKSILFRSLKP
jgi:signal peptidase